MPADWYKKKMHDINYMRTPAGLRRSMREATVTGAFNVMPAPMLVGTEPGTEDEGAPNMKIGPGGSDGHTHEAIVDSYGYGRTVSTTGASEHTHAIAAAKVTPYIDPSTLRMHSHDGEVEADKFAARE